MIAAPLERDVWVIYPRNSAAKFKASRNSVRDECKARGWNYQERASATIDLHSGGRSRDVLSVADATAIYRRAHRACIGVIVLAQTHVFLHPSQEEAIRKKLITRLQSFVRYKCFVELLDDSTDCTSAWTKKFADRFESAILTSGAEDEHDPRCLPLHVFSNHGTHSLFERKDRIAFDKQYGSSGKRVDLDGRRWGLSPRAYHGHEQLHVAGTALATGFHWDVQPGGQSTVIVTTSDVWVVSRYVNVYPDSHVRGDRPHAKKVI